MCGENKYIKKGEKLDGLKEVKMSKKKVKRNLKIFSLMLILIGGWRFYEKDVLLGISLFVAAWIVYVFQDELSKIFS